MPRTLRVDDVELAAALSSPASVQYLAPFFEQPRSVAQACEYLDKPMSKMHYWVRRWTGLGALEIVERRERAGRPIAFYRTVADEFVVPGALLPDALLEKQLAWLNDLLIRSLVRTAPEVMYGGDLLVYQSRGHRMTSIDRVVPGGQSVSADDSLQCGATLLLTSAEARELREELSALRDRWQARSDGRSRSSSGIGEQLLMLATVPQESE
ncbi:hypothetical protein IEE94_05735 [Yimella sp. cx-573]|nr:hypothetical protein [Yimella sp. cx-573]